MVRALLRLLVAVVLAVPLLVTAGTGPAGAATSHRAWVARAETTDPGHGSDPTNPAACDPIDPAQCMLPFPNDFFTKADPSSATGRRLDLSALAMPRNREGLPISPADYNRSDGFSTGGQILTFVPGMTKNADLAASRLPAVTAIGSYADADAGAVLLDTTTGQRWPIWTEVDQYTQEAAPSAGTTVQQDLIIHPATNLANGRRYIVALRHLVTDAGTVAQPSAAFRAYRDGTATDARAPHLTELFGTLADAGISRSDLYLAWDFTTASVQNVTGRLTAIRDDAFRQLGDDNLTDGKVEGRSPAFTVDKMTSYTAAQDPKIAREVTGHFTVPCYIAPTCDPYPVKCATVPGAPTSDCPGAGEFALDPTNPDATPTQTPGQTYSANFQCEVPRVGLEGAGVRLRPVEYGHGLFGGAGEVAASPQKDMASRFGMLYCATDWYGMASADVPDALADLQNLSLFPTLVDRVEQGELNFLYLARLMIHPDGLGSSAAFQRAGRSVIDPTQSYYDGNSQGGIYGGTVCAVSVDVNRCVLGVPGMNYSVLLPRSSDYVAAQPLTDPTGADPTDPTGSIGYSDAFDLGYPDQSQRFLVLSIIQTIWDRADPNGYANHMTTDPLPGTPVHHVLMQAAYGDHQVANITAETEARSIGAHAVRPALVPARYGPYDDPLWGMPSVAGYPYDGSAIVLFDVGPVRPDGQGGTAGTGYPPTSNVPPRAGVDPHEAPRRADCGQQQKDLFLRVGGFVTQPCAGSPPYFAFDWDGVTGLATTPAPVVPEVPLPALLGVAGVVVVGAAYRRRQKLASERSASA